jgi:membrane protein
MRRFHLGKLLKKTSQGWHQDGALDRAAALAYYAIFLIAPLLVIITFLVGLFHKGDTIEEVRTQFADFVSPEAAELLAKAVVNAGRARGEGIGYTVLALVMLVGGASAFAHQLQRAVDAMWHIPRRRRGFSKGLLHRLKMLGLAVGAGMFLHISVLVNAKTSVYRQYLNAFFPALHGVWHWVDNAVSLALILILYGLSYKLLPSAKVAWRDAASGAVIAALLFSAGRWIVAFYVFQGGFTTVYGAAGSVMVLLAWLFYSSLVFLFGARFARTCAEARAEMALK